ncbi:MAG: LysM peptidoglycan-binding domain-containing protein [Candidatus Omnitrophota bacterium]|nr:LysM peptidoglycan-binding domain-containing protein [Candidatus Omnitrophota bacterium]
MTKYLFGCFILLLLIAPAAFGEDGTGGYLEGGPSETFETPALDLQRSYYGTFEKEPEFKPVRGRTREAKPLTEPAIKEVPTFAEVEAAKVKATAEAAMEVSKKAEATAVEAKQAAAQAKANSEQAVASANQSIQTANQAIDKTNQAIDQVNAINEKVMQDNAKLRFEMEQKAQALEQKDQGLSDEMADLKKEIEKLTVKEAKKTFSFYTVKKGDFLIKIAGKKDIYGEGDAWKKIYQANRDKIKNPNLIYPGQKLQVPGPDAAAPAGVKVKSVKKVKKPVAVSEAPAKATSGKPVVRVPKQTPDAGGKPLAPGQTE